MAEKSGLIKVFDGPTDATPTVFADLRTEVHNYWDRGLLGIALAPDFPVDPHVYVLYTYDKDPFASAFPRWGDPGVSDDPCDTPPGPTTDGCVVGARLSRLTAAGSEMEGPEEVLIENWCQQYPSHSIGSLAFGADGKLYLSAGDGASFTFTDYGQEGDPVNPCDDPPELRGGAQSAPAAEGGALRSQDVRTDSDPMDLDGTILRLNPDGSPAPGNPLASSESVNEQRIIAAGLRNPFRFTIRPGTNQLWIGDVGWITHEEINRLPAGVGRNFGWPCYEGSEVQDEYDSLDLTLCEELYTATTGGAPATDLVEGSATAPFFSYEHFEPVVDGESCPTGSSSLAGLAFSDGPAYPSEYGGTLFFADYSRGCIWAMRADADGIPDPDDIVTFVDGAASPVDLEVGPDGRLYYADFDGGTIRRIDYTGSNQPPVAAATGDPLASDAPPVDVDFDAGGSSDPDAEPGDVLSYAWDLDGDGAYDDSSSPTPTHTYAAAGVHTASVEVTDAGGASSRAAVTIEVGHRPEPTIELPAGGTTWAVGEQIAFAGSATDVEDGPLPPSALDWKLILHHCPSNCHEHLLQGFADTDSDSFNAPDHDYPSHLELELTATDLSGATGSTSMELQPRTVDLLLTSSPPGLNVTLGAHTAATPFGATLIEGSQTSLSTASPQTLAGLEHSWISWSDGGARAHNVVVPSSGTYHATFTEPEDPLATPQAVPGLELEAGADRRQRASALAIDVACPHEACVVQAGGSARGVRFELEHGEVRLDKGEQRRLQLEPAGKPSLAWLRRGLRSGEIRRPVSARVDVAAADLAEGGSAHSRLKIRLRL